ncbi:MAG TPA: hypothetical protein VFA04_03155 [Bryobacteraceae bacterium]|nr:hypothetical protein [Bryobacteraceae bacterium]
MTPRDEEPVDIDRFILEQIETVPHMEALLLVWNSRPKVWSADEMGHAIFVTTAEAGAVLDDLTRRGFVAAARNSEQTWHYNPEPGRDAIMSVLDRTYRRELIRVTRLIHSKAPSSVREFAKAFRLKKERE